PFPFAAVLPFKRLGVAAIVGAARGVANMANGGPARVLAHDAVVLGLMAKTERLDDRADLLVSVEQFFAVRVVRREAGGQLATVLQIEQDAGHEAGDLLRPRLGRKAGMQRAVEMVNRGDPAFVL